MSNKSISELESKKIEQEYFSRLLLFLQESDRIENINNIDYFLPENRKLWIGHFGAVCEAIRFRSRSTSYNNRCSL